MQRAELQSTGHQSFVELCALYPTGNLSSHELSILRKHLEVCESCRKTLAEYREFDRQLLPLLATERTGVHLGMTRASLQAKQSLLSAAERSGEEETDYETSRARGFISLPTPGFFSNPRLAVAGLTFLAVVTCSLAVRIGYSIGTRKHAETSGANLTQLQTNLPADLGALKNLESRYSDLLRARDARITDLAEQANAQSNEIERLKEVVAKSADADRQNEMALSAAGAREASLAQDRADAQAQLKQASDKLIAIQDQLKQATDERASQMLRYVTLNHKVQELTTTLAEKDSQVQEQQTLLSSDRDIRELMGARDLFIADVFDIDREGRTKQPFGRVFYTKNKSLIFYAFDLDKQRGLHTQEVAFQAWGLNDADKHHPLNLGVFYMDNQTNRRWALKFDNPTVLEKINSVFVTVEPSGGSNKPSGKQLLFAYLEAQPNHP
jgi:hypothetical protein